MATNSYVSLEPGAEKTLVPGFIPKFNSSSPLSLDLSLNFIFMVAFIIVAATAMGMAVYGYGVLRLGVFGDSSEQRLTRGKKIGQKALGGFLGISIAYLTILTLNPDMLRTSISLEKLRVGSKVTSLPSVPTTTPVNRQNPQIPKNNDDPKGWEAIKNDAQVRAFLRNLPNGGISVNKSVCINPTQTSCTTVGSLPQSTLTMLTQLRNICSGRIMITGGVEAGHSSHGPGLTPIDLSLNDNDFTKCIQSFPKSSKVPIRNSRGDPLCFKDKVYEKFGFTFCDEISTDRHLHVYQ